MTTTTTTTTMQQDYIRLIYDVREEFPDFEILKKEDSRLMKLVDVLLKIITVGQMNTFLTGFITTMGNKVYIPASWQDLNLVNKIEILRHERIHMRQSKKYGRFIFSFLYLMAPLPVGLAFFRRKFEMEAYEESMRVLYFYKGSSAFTSLLREFFISQFISANYFWMWPFRKSIETWYDDAIKKIQSGD